MGKRTTKKRAPSGAKAPRAGAAAGPFGPIDAEVLGGLRERLERIGYLETALAARLGTPHISLLPLDRFPLFRARCRGGSPLETAALLFLLQGACDPYAALELFGDGDLFGRLVRAGLLRRHGRGAAERFSAVASIYPVAGALIATDPRYGASAMGGGGAARPAQEPVMALGGDSYALAYLQPARPSGTALDLCSGSGVQAIIAARRGTRVTAVDLSRRALAFGRWNAALNGVSERIEWRLSDLDGEIDPAARFDLVLANPPFVPSPHGGRARIAFRDGGASGEEVLARICELVPRRLAPGGTAGIVSVFCERTDETFRARLERWLGRKASMGALLARLGSDGPAEYAIGQTRRAFGDTLAAYEERHARWTATIERERVRRLDGGVLVLRAHGGPTPGWYRALDTAMPSAADPEALERAFRAADAAAAIVFPEEALDRVARAPEELVLVEERRPERPGRPEAPPRPRARVPGAPGGEVALSSDLAQILLRCDGKRTLRAAIAAAAGAAEAPAGTSGEAPTPDPAAARALEARTLGDLVELAGRGLLGLERG